jgi:3-hydroxyisobutyrate dehydrogenase-like beta-hydroxyacid dehydrogenase
MARGSAAKGIGVMSGTEPHEKRISVVGLGLMGTAITERLLEHGWQVFVWNRTREKGGPLTSLGARWTDDPFGESNRILISLYTSDVVKDVLHQMRNSLRSGQIIVDTTTGEPQQSAAMSAELAARQIDYLDAPISGSSEQTRRGEATTMVGGSRGAFDACADLWTVLGQNVFYVGSSGSAAKMKLISNLVLGLNRAVLAEGLAFASAINVDKAAALEILRGSMAYSRAMDVKGQKMIDGDFRVQARLSQHLKDVRLILEAASSGGLTLPFSQVHATLLAQAEAMGLGDLDNSAIIQAIENSRT